jgi:hypothetical protein
MHTQRANFLRSMLLLKGNQRVVVISVPWYVERRRKPLPVDASVQQPPALVDEVAFERRQS